jgi:TolA-binding protein
MKLKIVLLSTLLALPMALTAQPSVMGSGAEGYLSRGKIMYENRNYVGAIDQLSHITALPASANVREEADYYIALSKFERDETTDGLNAFIVKYPDSKYSTEATMRTGNYYFYHGKFNEALTMYATVREGALDGDANEDLLYRKGYCNLRLGKYKEAEQYYARLTGTTRYRDASAFYNAYIDYANGDYNKALSKFNKINRTGELGYQSQYYICQIDYANKEYDKVITLGKSLLEDKSNDYFDNEMYRLVGESYYHQGDDAQAKVYLKKYIDTAEGAPVRSAMYAMGVINFREGDYNTVISNMSAVTAKSDALAQSAYLYIGQSELKLNKLNDAAIAFEKSANMDYDKSVRETAFYNYAVSQSQGGRTPFNNSIEMFEQFLNEYPNSKYADKVEDYLLDAYTTSNDYDKALASISHIKNPSAKVLKAKQNVLYNLGVQSLSNNSLSKAKSYFQQAIAVGNYDKKIVNECRLWLAEAQYRSGQYKSAAGNQQAYIRSASRSDDNYGIAQYNLGYSLFQQRRYAEAKTAFRNAIESGTLSKDLLADAYNRVGDTNYYTKDFNAAEDSYAQAIGQNKGSVDYSMYQKALMLGLKKQYQDEVNQLDALIKDYPNSDVVPTAMLEKGNALTTLNKDKEAAATYDELVKKFPKSNEARKGLLKLAIAQKNMNNDDAAIEAYKRVITTYPSSEEAQAAAEDMKLIYADRGQLQQYSDFLSSVPNAPRMDVSEVDRLTFEAAEKDAIASKPSIAKMQSYIKKYPDGAFLAKAKYYVGRYDYEKGKYSAALTEINEALENNSDASFAEDALAIKSAILTKQGKNDEALEAYKSLADKSSSADNRLTAQLGVLRAAKDLGKWNDVATSADALLKAGGLKASEEKEVMLDRAVANAKLGNSAEAENDLKTLAKDPKNEYGAQAAYELANMQYEAGGLKASERTINALINEGTPHSYWLAKSFILLSDIYHKQGKNYEACEYLESLKSNYPGKDKEIFNEIDSRLSKWKTSTGTTKTKSKSKKTSFAEDKTSKSMSKTIEKAEKTTEKTSKLTGKAASSKTTDKALDKTKGKVSSKTTGKTAKTTEKAGKSTSKSTAKSNSKKK